ncbi:MAG: UDP-2,3-diacylglucosamine diphosphatase LpxI [Rhizobiaceae bacterium]
MTTPDAVMSLPEGRIGILAGSGRLPQIIAEELTSAGVRPFILALTDETGPWVGRFDHARVSLTHLSEIKRSLKDANVAAVVMAGGISVRPRLGAFPKDWMTMRQLPRLFLALRKGDDGLLRTAIAWLSENGFATLGAHELVPSLLAPAGNLTLLGPDLDDEADIAAAVSQAIRLGAADIGQAAVARDGVIIANEGRAGTRAMLEALARAAPAFSRAGVLAKMAKPQQVLRADLPSIGPDTIDQAAAAGLAGIVVEAGRSLVLDREEVIVRANALGIFVTGVRGLSS